MVMVFPGLSMAENTLKRQIDTKRSEIHHLEKRLKQTMRDINRLKIKEGTVIDRLHAVEERITTLRRELEDLETQKEETAAQVSETESALSLAESRLIQRQDEVAERLRTIYKRGRLTDIELVLSSDSFSGLLRRSHYLTLIGQQDRLDCERIAAEREEITRLKTSLEGRYHTLETVVEETDRKNRALIGEQEQHKAILTTLRGDITAKQKAQRNLEAAKQASVSRLSQLITDYQASLRKKRQKRAPVSHSSSVDNHTTFSGSPGDLLWPVQGRIISSFGRHVDERLGTITFNRGIDIAVAPGSDVRAVAPGRVVTVDWLRGYGNLLLLHHGGDYFTIYAHLSRIRVVPGQDVGRGEVIASSGDSGSLDGPKLHFEVLKGKEALNPLAWLNR
jgi:septal ring factor EnvC (AmiA/AmiB activator)